MAAGSKIRKTTKVRSVLQNFRVRRTPLDLWLGLFLLTVFLGVWYSFSIQFALIKFWMVIISIALYYGITAVSRRYAWWVVGFSGPVTVALVFYFLTADIWMRAFALAGGYFRPFLSLVALQRFWPVLLPHPNVMGGLLAMFLPFVVTYGYYAKKNNMRSLYKITVVCALLAVSGLLLTGSLGAWLALAVGTSVWVLWIAAKPVSRLLTVPRRATYWVFLAATAVIGGIFLGGILQNDLRGIEALEQRAALFDGTWQLVQDYPFTGSGLAAFPALYSEYIRIVPNFFVGYSNFYLDVLLELGVSGFLFLCVAWGITFWQLVKALRRSLARPSPSRGDLYWLRWASLVSLVVILVHGVTDDTLFGGLGTPFLFFTPAMAIMVSRRQSSYQGAYLPQQLGGFRSLLLVIGASLIAIVLLLSFRGPMTAAWLANQGALQMDRSLLQAWPRNDWRNRRIVSSLQPVQAQLQQALETDQQNRTAQQRLGMIAYLDRDFETAAVHLAIAFEQDQAHRGIKKCSVIR